MRYKSCQFEEHIHILKSKLTGIPSTFFMRLFIQGRRDTGMFLPSLESHVTEPMNEILILHSGSTKGGGGYGTFPPLEVLLTGTLHKNGEESCAVRKDPLFTPCSQLPSWLFARSRPQFQYFSVLNTLLSPPPPLKILKKKTKKEKEKKKERKKVEGIQTGTTDHESSYRTPNEG